jgi:hypothetical protein
MEKNNMTNILAIFPTYQKDGIDQYWNESLESFLELKAPEGVTVDKFIVRDNPIKNPEYKHMNTLKMYQNAHKKTLDEGYDYLLTFEHDMIVPEDGLIKLYEINVPVAYGLYQLRHGAKCVNAFTHIDDSPNLGKSFTHKREWFIAAFRKKIVRVSGVGMGFMLVKREVLEKIPFRSTDMNFAPDWGFAVDCVKKKIKQVCRFDVVCGHIEENGVILYPKEGNVNVTKVKVLKQFVYGRLYKQGQIAEVPDEQLDDFIRAGYVHVLGVPERIATKIMTKPTKKNPKAVKYEKQ